MAKTYDDLFKACIDGYYGRFKRNMAKTYESYYRFDGNNKRPKLTIIEDCTLEIDTARGVIRVNTNDGKVKVFIKRIPIALLTAPTIELVAGASGSPFDDKII